MPLPTLESLSAGLDRVCADVLGEAIGYRADGEPEFTPVSADVDYRDGTQELAGAQTVAQAIRVTHVLKADVPVKPTKDVRITLAGRPGKLFAPTNVVTDESGSAWEFDCETVNG